MDGVILVVAADDGIMPQTREHLDILTLLGIRHGLVALTKIDRVVGGRSRVGRGPNWPTSCRARSSKALRSCPCPTSPAKVSTRSTRRLQRLVAQITPKAHRRRVPPAGRPGVFRAGLRDGGGRHPGLRPGPHRRRSGRAAAQPGRPDQADRGLRPAQRRRAGRPVRGHERGPLGVRRDPPRRHGDAARLLRRRRPGTCAGCGCCPARSCG